MKISKWVFFALLRVGILSLRISLFVYFVIIEHALARENHPNLFCENNYTPHSMRHSVATHMLEAGVPLIVIKNILGHASLQSTQIYAEVTQNTLSKHIKEWCEKWRPVTEDVAGEPEQAQIIPEFLKTKSIKQK